MAAATRCFLLVIFCFLHASTVAKAAERRIRYEVSSGTWMTVDVSPDGRKIVFDLIGHLYELPISGGRARVLTHGVEWHRAPRYSPDGTQIAMVRDGDGTDEIWRMPANGGDPQRITTHPSDDRARVCGSPSWAPDGQGIFYGSDINACDFPDLRRIDLTDGKVQVLHTQPPWGMRNTGVLSPGSQFLYLTEQHDNATEEVTKGAPRFLMVLVRKNLLTGERVVLTNIAAGVHEFTPQISRNGRWLAYIQRAQGKSTLRIRALDNSGNRDMNSDKTLSPLVDEDDPVRFDESESRPAYSFTPDSQHIVISTGGKIHKIAISNGHDEIIPFTATIDRMVSPLVKPQHRLVDGPVQVRSIQWPRLTPDGKTLVFAAVGYLWVQQLPDGKPKRLTSAGPDRFEVMPALSPDGKTVAYVAVDREKTLVKPARLMTVSLAGEEPRTILALEQTLLAPSWSPDGKRIAFVLDDGDGSTFGWVALHEGRPHSVVPVHGGEEYAWGRLVFFSNNGEHLRWSGPSANGKVQMGEVAVQGGDIRALAEIGSGALGMMPSPDGRHALVIGYDDDLWLLTLNGDGSATKADFSSKALRRITGTGAEYATWQSNDSLIYSFGKKIYRYALGERSPQLIHRVDLTFPRSQGEGLTAFVNGRVITINGQSGAGEVLEKGTVLLNGRRIAAVGSAERVAIPSEARIIDATGLTLIPAIPDVHYHPNMNLPQGAAGAIAGFAETAAYGVTSVWLPTMAAWNEGFLPISELRETGRISGPRWSVAHNAISASSTSVTHLLTTKEDALRIAQHLAERGTLVTKEHSTPRRDQRRWFAQAAHEAGLGIVSHTQAIDQALSRATDGYTGFDHVPFAVPVYEDIREYLARTGIIWTPNIFSTGYGLDAGEGEKQAFISELLHYWPEQQQKWLRYYPSLGSLSTPQRVSRPSRLTRVAKAAAYLMNGGVKIAISAHNPPALFTHAEMWYLQQAGVPRADILRAGTMNSVEKLGLERDLGSLEAGKIADVLVLKGNPLNNIIHTAAPKYVVADGKIYDVEITPQ